MESKQISEVGDLQTHFHEVYIYSDFHLSLTQ